MYELPAPVDDGLYTPQPVGEWSRAKHYFLRRYIDAFTTSMKNSRWAGLHYIDLFAGAGIVRLEESGELEWGSPMIAARAPRPFDALHLCEKSTHNYEALRTRIDRLRLRSSCQVIQGDANLKIQDFTAGIPAKTLSLAFLDPYGLHLNFETLRALSARRVDLIIFFPDHLDALRNCNYVYRDDPSSNLDRVLGPGVAWRKELDESPRHKWAEVLRNLYRRQIRSLGYTEFECERIEAKGHPLYLLMFCSQHPLATKLWRSVSSKKPDDQRTFDFGPSD